MRGTGAVRFALPPEREARRAQARADRAEASPGARGAKPAVESLDAPTRDRFERLRAHRAQVATRARGCRRTSSRSIARSSRWPPRAPRSHAELLDVFGMGPARVEQYGDGFLEVLRGVR